MYAISISVCSCLIFVWKSHSKLTVNYCRCRKGCGHKKGSNGVAYDDSYCGKLRASLGSNFGFWTKMQIAPNEALKTCHSNCHHRPHHLSHFVATSLSTPTHIKKTRLE